MDEQEIDSWYEEEKQKLLDKYLNILQSQGDKKKAEQDYELKLNRLMIKYNQSMNSKLNEKAGKKSLLVSLKEKIMNLR